MITAAGEDLDSPVDTRFGRAPYFILYDLETGEFQAIPNQAANAGGGAGTQAAQAVISMGADTVVSGNIGPNAFQVLSAAGIRMLQATQRTVKDTIEALKKGELPGFDAPGPYGRFA